MKYIILSALAAACTSALPSIPLPLAGFIGVDTGVAPTISGASKPTYTITPADHKSGGDSYVVIFNQSSPNYASVADVLASLDLSEDHDDVKYTFKNAAFQGFAAKMGDHCLEALANMTDAVIVSPDVQVSAYANQRQATTWGLQSISSTSLAKGDATALDYTYTYDGAALGAGVDIYVVDTGINVDHVVFGGRAKMGYSFQNDTTDGDGHGTHVSGTAAGSYLGVSDSANLIGVKTLGAGGTGSSADTTKGIDWVVDQHNLRKKQPGFVGSVLSMSWGLQSVNTAIDEIIRLAASNGVHVVVAAGNDGADACGHSPGSSGGASGPAIVVGSVGQDNTISSFSNTGNCVDAYGPGENVVSSWITSNDAIETLSGTSMATPHVAGVVAYLAAQRPDLAQNPAAMKAYIASSGRTGVVGGTANVGDPKILINNGQLGTVAKREEQALNKRKLIVRNEARGLGSAGLNSVAEGLQRLGDKISNIFTRGEKPLRLVMRSAPGEVARLTY